MHINTIIQDLGILLLAAGIAGVICKRLGLSVIVGYLVAGIIIGPHSPPFSLIQDEARIAELSEVGLVFVMFSIGLELSLSKLQKMGVATLVATGLAAFFMLNFTLLLGWALHWSTMMSLFVAAMLMVSSSAVISKVMHELKLNHDHAAQMSLAMTIVEDVVAVIMITVLGTSVSHGSGGSVADVAGAGASAAGAAAGNAAGAVAGAGGAAAGAADAAAGVAGTVAAAAGNAAGAVAAASGAAAGGSGLGVVLGVLGAFVVLLILGGLLLVPRLLRRLEKRGDPEIQLIVVTGLLLMSAFLTVRAGYSLALGAFLFGAVVSEIKQKIAIEHSFEGLKSMFSSVFFVSIGMLIDLRMLEEVWLPVLLLGVFTLAVRPVACGFALMLVGVPPREARRAGMLLTPLGEFTFIIAQAGITAAVLPKSFYPLAVGLSILTVLATPVLNRFAEPIMRAMDWAEPRFVTRAIAAYHDWLRQMRVRPAPTVVWRLLRPRLPALFVEILFVSGLLIFSGRLLPLLRNVEFAAAMNPVTLSYIFWSVIAVLVLVPLVAIWRNISAMAMIVGEGLGGNRATPSRLQSRAITGFLRAAAAVGIVYWLYTMLPIRELPDWGWAAILVVAVVVLVVFSNKLIYWHSTLEHSLQEVLAEDSRAPAEVRAEARIALDRGLEEWDVCLEDCVVPWGASYTGRTLAELAIPAKFGCSILEMERNGYVITATDASLRLCPGDKLLLLGRRAQLDAARAFLARLPSAKETPSTGIEGAGIAGEIASSDRLFGGSVLKTIIVPESPRAGQTLAELKISRATSVRIAGIRREGRQIVNPGGGERLLVGDSLLVVGTLTEIAAFRKWMVEAPGKRHRSRAKAGQARGGGI